MEHRLLAQLYAEHSGKVSDKWTSYFAMYDRALAEYRDLPIKMLEIGIQNGGSLEIWSKYFPNAETFIGCDINPGCSSLEYEDERISVIVGDANSENTESLIIEKCPEFDIIIDDGSHLSSDIVKSFATYFPKLVDGGVFIAEDLHCSYWMEYEGGLAAPFSSITFFKHLADVINYQHWGIKGERKAVFDGFYAEYGVTLNESSLAQIQSVEFADSVCVVRKCLPKDSGLGKRFMAGSSAQVVPDLLDFSDEEMLQAAPSQAQNRWSQSLLSPYEELPLRLQELSDRDTQLTGMLHSWSWRLTRPLRVCKRLILNVLKALNLK